MVPKGLKIVDQRVEAHRSALADGIFLEGKVTDLATKSRLPRGFDSSASNCWALCAAEGAGCHALAKPFRGP
jgi:hypothetical protein